MRSVAIGFVDNRQRLPEQQRTIIGGGVFSGAATACHSFDLEKGSLRSRTLPQSMAQRLLAVRATRLTCGWGRNELHGIACTQPDLCFFIYTRFTNAARGQTAKVH